MNEAGQTPLLLIIWNRPRLVKPLISSISAYRPQKLYIASDGPLLNDLLSLSLVAETRKLVEGSISWPCEVSRHYSDVNQGCRVAVSSAISWFFGCEEQGIVLEDDVHPLPSFFPYMDELLAKYRYDSRVGSVSSHNFHRQPINGNSNYLFSVFSHCWGWGSWRRAWEQYDFHLSSWSSFQDGGHLESLGDHRFQRYWKRILDSTARGEIDTWDFAWTYSHWKAGMLSCVPDRCLVENAGFGPDATHTNAEACPLPAPLPMTFPLRHPQFVRPSPLHDRLTQRFQYRQPSPLERLQRKLRLWRQG